jgi:hypothetical protein
MNHTHTDQQIRRIAIAAHHAVRMRRAREATERADAECSGWSDRAYAFIQRYARRRTRPFLAEEMIYRSRGMVPRPADDRAWGGVVKRAVKDGVLRVAGVSSATRNSSLKRTYVGAR